MSKQGETIRKINEKRRRKNLPALANPDLILLEKRGLFGSSRVTEADYEKARNECLADGLRRNQ